MSLTCVGGTYFAVQTYLPASISASEEDEEEIESKASGNWFDHSWSGEYTYADDAFDGGDGTSYNPYQIATAGQLVKMAYSNGAFPGENLTYCYILTADIDLSAHLWTPIGARVVGTGIGSANFFGMFSGSFDGNGHTISGMTVNQTSRQSTCGLFYGIDGGRVYNLNLQGSISVTGSASSTSNSSMYVGALAGRLSGTAPDYYYSNIEDVRCKVSISVSRASGEKEVQYVNIGGIIGQISDTADMKNCVNEGAIYYKNYSGATLNQNAELYIGGVVGGVASGWSSSLVACYNTGSITIETPYGDDDPGIFLGGMLTLGGVVGGCKANSDSKVEDLNLYYCVNSGNINLYGQAFGDSMLWTYMNIRSVGGIIGLCFANESTFIVGCHNYGDIYAYEACSSVIGGIVGDSGIDNYVYISECSNFGDITAYIDLCDGLSLGIAGILGYADEGETFIQDTANYGNVTVLGAKSYDNIGGIAGRIYDDGWINRCINHGAISGKTYVGGIIGQMGKYETFDFWSDWSPDNNTKIYVYNCVNYSYVTGSSYVGQIAGFSNGTVKNCYGNSSSDVTQTLVARHENGSTGRMSSVEAEDYFLYLSDYNFFYNDEYSLGYWVTETAGGRSLTGWSEYSLSVSEYYDSTMYSSWMISPVVHQYYSASERAERLLNSETWDRNLSGGYDCMIVPMSALTEISIDSYYNKPTRESYKYQSGLIETTFKGQENSIYSSHVLLRGAYYNTTKSKAWISVILLNNEEFTFSGFDYRDPITYSYDNQNYINVGTSSTAADVVYPINFNICTKYIQGGSYSYINSASMRAKFRANADKVEPVFVLVDANGKIIESTTNLNKANVDLTIVRGEDGAGLTFGSSGTNVYYEDTMNYTISPDVGYAVYKIEYEKNEEVLYAADNRYSAVKKDNLGNVTQEENTFDHGTGVLTGGVAGAKNEVYLSDVSGTFTWDYGTPYIYLKKISYGLTYQYVSGPGAAVEEAQLASRRLLPDSSISLWKELGNYMSYSHVNGYIFDVVVDVKLSRVYNFKDLKEYDDVSENVYNNFYGNLSRDHSTVSYAQVVAAIDWDRANNQSENLCIRWERTQMTFDVGLEQYSNSWQNVGTYAQTDLGGKTSFDMNGELAEERTFGGADNALFGAAMNFAPSANVGYYFDKMSFTSDYSTASSLAFPKITPVDNLTSFNGVLEAWLFHLGRAKFEAGGYNDITLYNFYTLAKFDFTGVIEGSVSGDVVMVSRENNVANTKEFVATNELYCLAPVSLTASVPSGVAFVGFYLEKGSETYLLSREMRFSFENYATDISNGKAASVKIIARFEPYATTGAAAGENKGIYRVVSKENLIWLSEQVRRGETFEGVVFTQGADIDLSGVNFNPIGTENSPFKGAYNGNGYTISGLTLTGGAYGQVLSNRGLFGFTDGATIKNLTLIGGKVSGYANVGSVVGTAKNTTFKNVNNHSCVIEVDNMTFVDVYGAQVTEKDGNIGYDDRVNFAGLVGYAENCTFENCSNIAEISTVNSLNVDSEVAGLVGCLNGGSVGQCFSKNSGFELVILPSENAGSVANSFDAAAYYDENGELFEPTSEVVDANIWFDLNGKWELRAFYW